MSDNKCVSFVWKIEDFSMLPHQLGERIVSPSFVFDIFKDVEFYLWFYPRGELKEGQLSIFLLKKPELLDLKLSFTFIIESTEPSERKLKTVKDHVLQKNWGFPVFVSVDEIHDETKHYLPKDVLTFRCVIRPAKESSTDIKVNQDLKTTSTIFLRKYCASRACSQVQKRRVTWSIRNVKERIQRPEKVYILLLSFLENSPSLKLTLDFNKIQQGNYFPISMNQTCLSSQVELTFVKCIITVIHEEFHASKTDSYLFKKNTSDVWCFPPFLTPSMLTDKKCLVNDTLFLRCEFFFSYKDKEVHFLENNHTQFRFFECTFSKKRKNSELATCFENVYSSGKFCDVELKAGGGTFPYYKAVLCARSSVFRAMFENDMKEKNSNVVEIEDVDPDTLQRMLAYMLSDVVKEDLSPEDACKLYLAADKYDLASLKSQCSLLLARNVSLLNVCDLLEFADARQDYSLMTAVGDLICSKTEEVFNSARWKSFMKDNPKLSSSIMHKMMMGMCQI